MYQVIILNYNMLVKWNHKRLSIEYFHHFLNKSVTIVAKERGTNNMFVPTSIAASYLTD